MRAAVYTWVILGPCIDILHMLVYEYCHLFLFRGGGGGGGREDFHVPDTDTDHAQHPCEGRGALFWEGEDIILERVTLKRFTPFE